MAEFIKGDVVVVSFPFSDMSQSKRRPALIVAELQGDDLILCQITSQIIRDDYSVSLENGDFESGGLNKSSNIRPNRIFTADRKIMLYKAGHIKKRKNRRDDFKNYHHSQQVNLLTACLFDFSAPSGETEFPERLYEKIATDKKVRQTG